MQTPFSIYTPNFKQHLLKVVVEVNSMKVKYFKAKQFLLSQTLLEEKDNGNLLVEYTVTYEHEVDELIKKWLPHVKVISPLSLKESICADLREYLKDE